MTYGIDKVGDNQVLKFYIETMSDDYALKKEDLLKESIDLLFDIIFNPLTKNGMLEEEFLGLEKSNLQKIIESKIDNKGFYALNRCIENMYGDKGFGIYKYGYLEDLEKITIKNVSDQYKKIINEAKIDIYVSGNFNEEYVKNLVQENENILKLEPRVENIIINSPSTEVKQKVDKPKEIEEKMNISQGKLVIGLDILLKKDNIQSTGMVLNGILGDGANSMLFQNVREKAGLAYTASSSYNKLKNNIFIRCGIESKNYEKAVKIIKEQLDDIKNGKFTDDDIQNCKTYIISGLKAVEAEQDTEVVYYIGQELSKKKITVRKQIEEINAVTKEQIVELAKSLQINTIYFLTGENNDDSEIFEDD